MTASPASPLELQNFASLIEGWVATELSDMSYFIDFSADQELAGRWYLRLRGECREATAIWFTLGQRTLKYECYFMSFPEENREAYFEFLLRQNHQLVGAQFGIDPEGAVVLTGEVSVRSVTHDELDRIVGSVYEYVERFFRPALAIGFASRLRALK
jgi:hypothetical protein